MIVGILSGIGNFLSGAGDIYLFVAVTGTVILVLQFVLSMMGADSDLDMDMEADFSVDFDGASDIFGINFFSLKAIIAFITFFGWGGYFFGHTGWMGFFIAFGCGLVMMILTSLVLSLLLKLQHSGNVTVSDMIGKRGTVYLSIPAERMGGGVVTVTLSGCTRRVGARSDEELKTGTAVVVTEDLGNGNVLVKKS